LGGNEEKEKEEKEVEEQILVMENLDLSDASTSEEDSPVM